MAALPALPLGAAGDTQAKSEYLDALNRVSQAIDAQSEQKFPWFEMAGAFLNPGQSGSFGEGLGRAAGVVGQYQQRQQANAVPLAQMKMALAGQKYEVENKARALQLLGAALGTTPEIAAKALQAGAIKPGSITPELYAQISQLSPEVGSLVKNIFDMQSKVAEQVREDLKAGMSMAELRAKYGTAVDSLIPANMRSALPQPAAAPAQPAVPPAQPAVPPAQPVAVLPSAVGATTQPVAPQPALAGQPVAEAPIDTSLEGMPLAAQVDVMKERAKEMDKPFLEKRNTIVTYDPAMLNASTRDLRELYKITEKYPRIFGLLMQDRGLLAGLQAAAQAGITAGTLGSISAPVEEFIKKNRLTYDEEVNLQVASKIIARQFFENAKINKATLGPQISNSDVILLKAPAVTEQDSAEAIRYWVKQNILGNKQREDLYRSLSDYEKQAGGRSSPTMFFRSRAFDNILQKYDRLFNDLMVKHSPAYTPAPGGR